MSAMTALIPLQHHEAEQTSRRSAIDEMLERNETIARTSPPFSTDVRPALQAIVLTCCDHRVDPAHVLGLDAGEAVVIRNAGGRVTPDVLACFEVLAVVAMVEALVIEPEMIVMHHTDCGMSRLGSPEVIDVARRYLSHDAIEPEALWLDDPFRSVLADVQRLRSSNGIPSTMPITAVVYDVVTGVATKVGTA
jgi:carbonic anhydrase